MNTRRKDTTRDGLRRWLAGELGLEEVPAPLWALLEDDHYVSEALNSSLPDADKRELLKRAKRQLRFHRQMSTQGSSEGKGQTFSEGYLEAEGLDPSASRDRANAAVPYLLKQHALNLSVESIRERVGAPLARDEARELLQAVDPTTEDPALVWNGEEAVEVDLGRSGIVREALETAQYLHGPWLPMDMVWWILTNEPPRISVIQAEIMGWGWSWPMTTLRIPVWASTHEVAQFYTRLRQIPGFRRLHDPAPCPPEKRLAVFRFVSEHSEFDTKRLWKWIFAPRVPWRKLMQLWNEQPNLRPGWVYEDPRNFRRAFVDTRDALFKVRD